MPADQDMSSGDRDYAAYLLALARQELAEVQSADTPTVAAVVLHALVELFEDAANGYVALAGLPVAIRQGLEWKTSGSSHLRKRRLWDWIASKNSNGRRSIVVTCACLNSANRARKIVSRLIARRPHWSEGLP
ncbi:MAG TPA: hypothetical protein VNG51_15965 [Ktedonobacteraceae bacterium]|nr:hypothetical protein [Ktedonobacteraceae bacterium]